MGGRLRSAGDELISDALNHSWRVDNEVVVDDRLACKTVCTFVAHHTGMAWTEDPCQVFNAAAGDDGDPVSVEVLFADFLKSAHGFGDDDRPLELV